MTLEELEQADVPRVWLVSYNGGKANQTMYAGPDDHGETGEARLTLNISDYLEGEVISVTLIPAVYDAAKNLIPHPELAVTIDLSE